MRWNKLRKIIIRHPYIISDDFHMPMRHAEKLQEEEGYPSFEEMVNCARRRSSLPDSAWQDVYTAIEKNRNQSYAKPKQHKELSGRFIIRWAIVGLCILLVAGYLTLVPSGKALAASIAKVIVQIFDDGFLFTPATTPAPTQNADGFKSTTTEYSDFDTVESATGRQFLQINNAEYTLDSLQLYESNVAGKRLYAFYETDDGLTVSLYQKWGLTTDFWNEINSDETVWEETFPDGTKVYCLIDSSDKTFTAHAIWNDTIITIYADDGIPYEDILSAIG